MTAENLGDAFELVTGMIPSVTGLFTTFPINIFVAVAIAGVGVGVVKMVMGIFKRRRSRGK